MNLPEKIMDFFNMNQVVLEHTHSQESVDKLNRILNDMGAVLIKVSGIPTSGLEISAYKLGKNMIKVELWDYEDIRLVGKKKLINEIKAKITANHEAGVNRGI
ncbi:hypothetical protein [Victivallis vadensis]|uniref:hypothetical protein n=1 Tax=Victivallis vadensis TaxID=172901 RepID=UPI002596BED9|nr:hypothetical protein [uncultured Victivallis sp.]